MWVFGNQEERRQLEVRMEEWLRGRMEGSRKKEGGTKTKEITY